MVPKKLHFTYKTEHPPEKFQKNLNVWKKMCPDWEMHYYSDAKIFDFFKVHFPEYLSDLSKITLGAVLADVFRYAVLYIDGGMYTDIDTIPLKKIPKDWLSYQTVLGYEFQLGKGVADFRYKHNVICQWTMLSAPKNPLFKKALEKCIKNLRDINFHFSVSRQVLHATGPLLFTSIASDYLQLDQTLVLDMEIFGSFPETLPISKRSVVEHQYHGEHGWTLGIKFPNLRL
ncbi:glycosyltransferase family 32 protein [Candidatus Neptunichlamydia sp. REUL1]|uniref:glycosyltransferase family 32 protein n=1 Tax=Candidatus Neptunichlamydia sp. REUL1 TaxID=3064277 RepID=UPI00292DD1AD|nr:glycosyltransferase [Candidatus Neptunochlamydia sp. REUL1]